MRSRDWRDASADEVSKLYAAERERWHGRLSWDTADSWTIVEQGRRAGHVPGWILEDDDGTVVGWTFYVLFDGVLQIGALVARRAAVARLLVDAILAAPEAELARALSGFLLPTTDALSSALVRQRFSVEQSLYLSRALVPGVMPEPAGSPLRPWRDDDLAPAVRLAAAAYHGVPGASCFAPWGTKREWAHYVTQLVRSPGCGRFDPTLSFVDATSATELRGAVLTTWIGARTTHVAQLMVSPSYRRAGIGERLLERALDASASAGAAELTLLVDGRNTPARALYARHGFVERARFIFAERGARRAA